MSNFPEFDPAKQPRYKVELHVHLDGSVRITTIWELAQKKGIKLDSRTLEDLYGNIRVKCPATLGRFLKSFSIFMPVIAGDPEAIERIAYEFCEDAAKQGVFYCEVRYCPHSMTGGVAKGSTASTMTPRDVVLSVNHGLTRGSADFKLTVRSILCCIRGRPEWSNEILDLCIEFQNQGIVGIDIAGDEGIELCAPSDFEVFRRAASQGIHRTVHAGEAGPASNVRVAVQDLLAERIGHGYHIVDDDSLYLQVREWGVHFEACPYSSCATGSVSLACPKHPIVKFAEDNVNFSISRDDPTIIQKTLDQEYKYLKRMGLKEVHFSRANFNAARSCFLPPSEKAILIQQLREIYGI